MLKFDLEDLTSLAPVSCIDPIEDDLYEQVQNKNGLCQCVQSNLNLINYEESGKFSKREYLEKTLEKTKIGLLSLSEDIFLVNKDYPTLDPGESCNSKKRFQEVVNCGGKLDTIFSKDERQKMTNDLYQMLLGDSSIDGHRFYPPPNSKFEKSLFDRNALNGDKSSCMNSKGVSQKFLNDISDKMLVSQLTILRKIGEGSEVKSNRNLFELILRLRDRTNMNSVNRDTLIKVADEIKSNPILKKMAESESFYTEFINQPESNISNLIDSFKNTDKGIEEIKDSLVNKCDTVFKAYEKTFCASQNDPVMPIEDNDEMKEILLDSKYGDQDEVANIMETSSILKNNYCQFSVETKSINSTVDNLIEPILSPYLKGSPNFSSAVANLYKFTTLDRGNKLCEHLPPEMNKLVDAMKKMGCGNDSLDSDCRFFKAADIVVRGTFTARKEEISERVKKEAKTLGITDVSKIAQMVEEAVSKIDTNEIMRAYSEYNSAPKENSVLVNRFLGIDQKKVENVASIQTDANPSAGENSEVVDETREVDSTGNIRSASVNSSDVKTLNYQNTLPQNRFAKQARENTEDTMDKFYREIARRATQVKDDPTRRAPGAAGKTKPRKRGKTAEQKLLDALKPPYEIPESREPANTLAFDDSYDTSENYYETDADSYPITGGSTDNSIATGTPTQKDDYNDALGAKQEANEQDRIARANAGKIKPSPFKKSLGGRSSGVSGGGRGPASSGSSGGSGGAFLGGGADNSIPIEVDSIQEDIEALIENVYAEKARGLEGENSEHALLLLALLDGSKKKITIKDPNNENLEVDIVRNENGLKLIPTGNMAYGDPYQVFVSKVEKVIIKQKQTQYNENFDSLLKRLRDALNSESGEIPPPEKTARYRDYVGR